LDRRQSLLDQFLKTQNPAERLQIADGVRQSEQLLLKQEIPDWLEKQLLDEHIGLLSWLTDQTEFNAPAQYVQFQSELVAARKRFHPEKDHWEILMAEAFLKEARAIASLESNSLNQLKRARELYQEGQTQFDAGAFEAAEPPQRECIRIYLETLGRETIGTALAMRIYGRTLVELERGREAASVLYEAARIGRQTVGLSPLVVGALGDSASGFYLAGHLKEATKLQMQVVRDSETVYGLEHEQYANAINNLALYMSETGDPREALKYADQAGKIYANLEGLTAAQADNSNLTGIVAMAASEYEKGMASFIKAVKLKSAAYGPNDPSVAIALGNAAQAALLLGHTEQATRLMNQSMAIVDNTMGRDDPRAADHLVQLATIRRKEGRKKEAAVLIRQACDLMAQNLGKDHPEYAKASLDLAVIYFEIGQRAKAEETLIHAAEVFEQKLGPDSAWLAQTLSHIAVLQSYNPKKEFVKQVINIAGSITVDALEESHPEYADYLYRAATVYQNMDEHGLAKSTLMEAVQLAQDKYGEKHPEYATAISALGVVLLETEEKDRGKALVEQSERVLADYLGREHPEVIEAMVEVARVKRLLGNPRQALEELVDLEALAKKQLGKDGQPYANVLVEMGRAYLLDGDPEAAQQSLVKAGNIFVEQLGEESPDVKEVIRLIQLARTNDPQQINAEIIHQLEKHVPEYAEYNQIRTVASQELTEAKERQLRITKMIQRLSENQ